MRGVRCPGVLPLGGGAGRWDDDVYARSGDGTDTPSEARANRTSVPEQVFGETTTLEVDKNRQRANSAPRVLQTDRYWGEGRGISENRAYPPVFHRIRVLRRFLLPIRGPNRVVERGLSRVCTSLYPIMIQSRAGITDFVRSPPPPESTRLLYA